MQGVVSGGLLQFFVRFPKLAGAFGLLFAVAFGFLGIANWAELQTMPANPEKLTLPEAAARVVAGQELWVEMESVEWDCHNIVYSAMGSGARTEIAFTDESRSVLGVAQFGQRLACEEVVTGTASGVLHPMGDEFYERLPGRGFDLAGYSDAKARLYLCAYCGRGNSTLAVICGAIGVPIGLGMYPLCLWLKRHYEKKGLL